MVTTASGHLRPLRGRHCFSASSPSWQAASQANGRQVQIGQQKPTQCISVFVRNLGTIACVWEGGGDSLEGNV
jgi:hypothetical protein